MSEEKNLCPNCGDDRTAKASLIQTGTPSRAFCNERCLMEWQHKRIAELEQQLEAEDRVHTAAMKYFQEVGDKAEELRRHRRLLRAVAKAAETYVNSHWNPNRTMTPESPEANLIRLLQAAIDAGALTEANNG